MNAYLIPGLLGLLTGLLLNWGQLSQAEGLRRALGLRRSLALRTGLTALSWGVLLTALLMWLAVIDVDGVDVLPLSLGTLLGGALFGVCAGLCGFTPTTAFAGLPRSLEALCVLAGCFAGTLLSPVLGGLLAPLHTPWTSATLFQVTLDEPWLLSGGNLGLGALGALLAVWGLCVPSPRPVIVEPTEPPLHRGGGSPSGESEGFVSAKLTPQSANADSSPTKGSLDNTPDSAPAETVVAVLEGEEPLIVDTAMDEADQSAEDAVPDESDDPAEPDKPDAPEESDKPED